MSNIELEEERDLSLMIVLEYSNPYNDDEIEINLVKFENDTLSDFYDDVGSLMFSKEISEGTVLVFEERVFWFIKSDFDAALFQMLGVEKFDFNNEVFKWYLNEFEVDSLEVNNINFKTPDEVNENYQKQINTKVEQQSNYGSVISIARVESDGTVYILNSGSEDIIINTLKVGNCSKTGEMVLSNQNVGDFKIDNCALEKNLVVTVVAISDEGVVEAKSVVK